MRHRATAHHRRNLRSDSRRRDDEAPRCGVGDPRLPLRFGRIAPDRWNARIAIHLRALRWCNRRRGDGDCDVGLRLAVSSGPPGSRADLAAHQRLYRLSRHTLGAILLTTSLVITQWSWHCRIAGRGARIEAALGIGRTSPPFIIEAAAPKAATRRSYGVGRDVDFSGHPWLVAREHDAARP